MLVYVLFTCWQVVIPGDKHPALQPGCEVAKEAASHFPIQSLDDCQAMAERIRDKRGGLTQDPDGKYTVGINGNRFWFECRNAEASPAPHYTRVACDALHKTDAPRCVTTGLRSGLTGGDYLTPQECEQSVATTVVMTDDRSMLRPAVPQDGRYYLSNHPFDDKFVISPGSSVTNISTEWIECRKTFITDVLPVNMKPSGPAKVE